MVYLSNPAESQVPNCDSERIVGLLPLGRRVGHSCSTIEQKSSTGGMATAGRNEETEKQREKIT